MLSGHKENKIEEALKNHCKEGPMASDMNSDD
jgi:hypothetical protein